MEDLFKCSNCHDLDDNVFESECCGVIYCNECKGKHEQHKEKCEHCNNEPNYRPIHFVNRIVKSFIVKCKYDCGKICQFQDMKPHLASCSNREYKCSFDDCTFIGKRDELMKHLITSHDIHLLCLMETMSEFDNTIISQNKKPKLKNEDNDLTINNNLFEIPLINNEDDELSRSLSRDRDHDHDRDRSIDFTEEELENNNSLHNLNHQNRFFFGENVFTNYRRHPMRIEDNGHSEENDFRPPNLDLNRFRNNDDSLDDRFDESDDGLY